MPVVAPRDVAHQTMPPQSDKKTSVRNKDNGAAILSHMEHFVRLVRKVQHAGLVQALVEKSNGRHLVALSLLTQAIAGTISITIRNAVFIVVAELPPLVQLSIERAAERVLLLCDEYGMLAVSEQLHAQDPNDAAILAVPTDKFSCALYLYLCQAFPIDATIKDRRFDHAEARQEMLRQGQSEKYSSHYLGPKGIEPHLGERTEAALRERLLILFPHIDPEEIVIETFVRRNISQPEAPIVFYTLKAMFNGASVPVQKIINGEVVERNEAIVTSAEYTWQPAKGTLSVFCDDKEVRSELASLFHDIVLGGYGDTSTMSMREFNLLEFAMPTMIDRIKKDRIAGIESIDIQHIVVAKPQVHQIYVGNKIINRIISSDFCIRRHRFDNRSVYEIAKEDSKIDDLTDYEILQVKLSVRMGKRPHRGAHNVSVEITAPNGFSDRSKAEEDSELIFTQLERLGCAYQQ